MAPTAVIPQALDFSKAKADLQVPKTTFGVPEDGRSTKRKIICFSDFDGTIFMQDTGHVLFDSHGCGPIRRQVLDEQIKSGERSFKEVSEEMWGSLNVPFEDGFDVMKTALDIDVDFQKFHCFCIDNDIPFHVISAGLKPILRRVLDQFLGEEEAAHIEIVANDAQINTPGTDWKPVWLHDCELGHDKARSITEARAEATLACEDGSIPLIVFIGDGVRGLRLEEYCIENKIGYLPFDTFADIQKEVEAIKHEDEVKTGGLGMPSRSNPRANMWRRISSRNAIPMYLAATPAREEKMILWPEAFSAYQPKEQGIPLTA